MSDTQKSVFLVYSKFLCEYYNGQRRPNFFLKRLSTMLGLSKKLLKKKRRVTFSEDCKDYDGLSPKGLLFKEYIDDIFGPNSGAFRYVRDLYQNGKQDELKIIETMLIDLIRRCQALPNKKAKTATLNFGSSYSQGAHRGCIQFFMQILKNLRKFIVR